MNQIVATVKNMPIQDMGSSLFEKSANPKAVFMPMKDRPALNEIFQSICPWGYSNKFFEWGYIPFLFECLPSTDFLLTFFDRGILSLLAEKKFQVAISSIVTGNRYFVFLQGKLAI